MSSSFARAVLPPGSSLTSVPCWALGDSTWCSGELALLLKKGSLSDFLCQFYFHCLKLTLKRFFQGLVINRAISSPSSLQNTHRNPSRNVTKRQSPVPAQSL